MSRGPPNHRYPGRRALVALGLIGLGCQGDGAETGTRVSEEPNADAGRVAYPPEPRDITLVIWPFYDFDDVLAATEDALPVPIDGVTVCLNRARPHLGTFEDFVEMDGPCTVSQGDEPVELRPVPPDSELLVTAEKPGYWPNVIAAMTGQWSTDVTRTAQPNPGNRLYSRTSPGPWPAGAEPREDAGTVQVAALGAVPMRFAWLGGVTVSLVPGGSAGPHHTDGRQVVHDAVTTQPGLPTNPFARELVWANARPGPYTLFADVPQGDHIIRLEHPSAGCDSWGLFDGDPVYGYPAGANEVRVPVLAGHVTQPVRAGCGCVVTDPATRPNLDPATCGPAASPTDGGVP
jgi:hypothetical protein